MVALSNLWDEGLGPCQDPNRYIYIYAFPKVIYRVLAACVFLPINTIVNILSLLVLRVFDGLT